MQWKEMGRLVTLAAGASGVLGRGLERGGSSEGALLTVPLGWAGQG